MAKSFALAFSVFLVLSSGCLAARQVSRSGQQQNECLIDRLQAREPDNRVEAEAGQIESWDYNQDDFQCAGVAATRITIQQNGLHLPSYSNAPQLIYIVQGRGVLGTVLSGCPETFEESQEEQGRHQQQGRRQIGQHGQQQSKQLDRHQKVRRIREGDVIAIPAGVAYWSYNDGNQDLVAVSLLDVANENNQLDQNPRKFYLAGNPEDEFGQQQGQSQHRPRQQQGKQQWGRPGQQQGQQGQQQWGGRGQQGQRGRGQQYQGNGNNVFSGFDTQVLAQAFNIDEETARNLQSDYDNRNQIVRVRGQLDFLQPPRGRQEGQHDEEEQQELEQERQQASRQGGRHSMVNGLEETFCSTTLKENIGNPQRADIFSPQAGRISTLNSRNLPILAALKLSAERGFFYGNAIYSPHWNVNAHSVVYVIRGSARVQVVNHNGDSILDDEVREGQLFIVPQNHAVIKQAGNEGFEYIAFKTNENAVINTLAGRTSFLRALPDEVIQNAYQIDREQARQLKYNRQETTALSASQSASSYERRAIA